MRSEVPKFDGRVRFLNHAHLGYSAERTRRAQFSESIHFLAQRAVLHQASPAQSVLDIIQDGPFSTVTKEKWFSDDGTREEYLAVKASPTVREGSKEPHDIIKELRILSRISHINVSSISFTITVDPNYYVGYRHSW